MPGACGLWPCARTHHKKGLVPHLPIGWGEQQIPQYRNTAPIQLSGRTSACRVYCGTDLTECVSAAGYFLRPTGGLPPKLLPTSGGWVYCLVPEAPLIRGMPTGVLVFLEMCGLQPCARTHLKKGLVPHSSGGGMEDKYHSIVIP